MRCFCTPRTPTTHATVLCQMMVTVRSVLKTVVQVLDNYLSMLPPMNAVLAEFNGKVLAELPSKAAAQASLEGLMTVLQARALGVPRLAHLCEQSTGLQDPCGHAQHACLR